MVKKNIIFQLTILGLCLWLSFLIFPSSIRADLVGQNNQATLSLSPTTGAYNIGDSFSVEVKVNTNGQDVVVVAAYLNYNSSYFRADSIETTGSVFTTGAEKTIDSTTGVIKITRGIPTPGVKTTSGQVATINFTAISATSPSTDNLAFDFAAGSTLESNVILDDGLGTDILNGVYNARYTVIQGGDSLDLTPPAVSSISVVSITDSGATVNWTTNESADSQVEYGLTTSYGSQTTLDGSLAASHSVIISGLSPGTIYHYRIKTKDASGNLATTGDRTFTTTGGAEVQPLPSTSLPSTDEGKILTSAEGDKIYLIVNNQRRWIANPEVFLSYGLVSGSQKTVSQSELDQYPLGPDITQPSLSEGILIRARGDYRVYIIKPPYKRHIFNPAVFDMYQHFDWSSIQEVESDIVSSYITSDLYRALNDYRVYSLEEVDEVNGIAIKHHLNLMAEQFSNKGYSWNQVFIVNQEERDYYETGGDLVE